MKDVSVGLALSVLSDPTLGRKQQMGSYLNYINWIPQERYTSQTRRTLVVPEFDYLEGLYEEYAKTYF